MAPAVTSPSLLILGADAVLAAAPATPVQLAHACLAAGYRAAVPVSWGEEIIARRVLDAIENANGPLVLCACPFVTRRLGAQADDIGSMVLPCVAPPVATAAYLRALYAPAGVRITYAGACPSAGHATIDAWLTPAELLADLAGKGIQLARQPTEFDSVLPPDRRRHYSEPGGVPSSDALRRVSGAPELVELDASDFAIDLAQALLAGGRRVIDAAPAVGCFCSGAGTGISPAAARARIRSNEPPRAPSPVVDHDVALDIDVAVIQSLSDHTQAPATPHHLVTAHSPSVTAPVSASPPSGVAGPAVGFAAASPAETLAADSSRVRSSVSGNRAVIGAMPQSRSAGRHLPRAYVARRRSSPKGIRQSGVRRQIDVMGPFHERRPIPRWLWIAGMALALVVVSVVVGMMLARG